MRAIKIVLNKNGKETMYYSELRLLGESIKDDIDENEMSSVNNVMNKKKAFEYLIGNFMDTDTDGILSHGHFRNVVREFILNQKTMSDRYKKVKIIKEIPDFREEKLGKLLDD